MSNYLGVMKSLIEEIKKKTAEFEKEIKPLQKALEDLRIINTACEFCNGKGVCHTYDAAGQKEELSCNYCGGSGTVIYCCEDDE